MAILRQLFLDNKNDHLGKSHTLQLLDSFKVSGPNGTHDVIITDILVPIEVLQGLHLLDAKVASYHAMLGLAYLHEQGIIHGGKVSIQLLPAKIDTKQIFTLRTLLFWFRT